MKKYGVRCFIVQEEISLREVIYPQKKFSQTRLVWKRLINKYKLKQIKKVHFLEKFYKKITFRSGLMSGVNRNSNFITTILRSITPDFNFDDLLLETNEK
jgi:hypothetical protein